MVETVRERHIRLHEESEQRTINITEKITSSVPNLEEDESFKVHDEHRRQGAWSVADKKANESKSPDDFQRVEISYNEGFRFNQQMVYVVGYGTLHYSPGVPSEHALFYLDKWEEVESRSRRTKPVEISRLESFELIGD